MTGLSDWLGIRWEKGRFEENSCFCLAEWWCHCPDRTTGGAAGGERVKLWTYWILVPRETSRWRCARLSVTGEYVLGWRDGWGISREWSSGTGICGWQKLPGMMPQQSMLIRRRASTLRDYQIPQSSWMIRRYNLYVLPWSKWGRSVVSDSLRPHGL